MALSNVHVLLILLVSISSVCATISVAADGTLKVKPGQSGIVTTESQVIVNGENLLDTLSAIASRADFAKSFPLLHLEQNRKQLIGTNTVEDSVMFEILGQHYLAVANKEALVIIYQWNPTSESFEQLQELTEALKPAAVEFVSIEDSHFLICGDDTPSVSNSRVFKWNGASFVFVQLLNVPGSAAKDWEAFQYGTETYLAVALFSVDSRVYRYSAVAGMFDFTSPVSTLPSLGAVDVHFFTMGGALFLSVSNSLNNVPPNDVTVGVFKLEGAIFQLVEDIAAIGPRNTQHFMIDGEHYLAVAEAPISGAPAIPSRIWRLNQANINEVEFVLHQSIPTKGAEDWHYFEYAGQHWLLLANFEANEQYQLESEVFRWGGQMWNKVSPVNTIGACDWEHMIIDDSLYIFVSNQLSSGGGLVDSVLYTVPA